MSGAKAGSDTPYRERLKGLEEYLSRKRKETKVNYHHSHQL
jgi:hypothetical protein